jgi:hypothetical protein
VIDCEPLEDGYDHPVEDLLKSEISKHGPAGLDRIRGLVLDAARPALGASILRCLGRLDALGTPDWRATLVTNALAQADVELRDADPGCGTMGR